MDLLRSAYGSDSDGEVRVHACMWGIVGMCAVCGGLATLPLTPTHPFIHPPQAPPAVAAEPTYPSKRKRGGKGAAAAAPAPAPPALPAVPVQLVSRTVNSAPFVNPALKTVMNRPGFIPPTQTQLTTNVKVR